MRPAREIRRGSPTRPQPFAAPTLVFWVLGGLLGFGSFRALLEMGFDRFEAQFARAFDPAPA